MELIFRPNLLATKLVSRMELVDEGGEPTDIGGQSDGVNRQEWDGLETKELIPKEWSERGRGETAGGQSDRSGLGGVPYR